jgi:hypothetical protein
MFSRCIAILVCSMLPMFAATLPIGPAHTANLMVSGIVATLLCFGALVDNRFRFGVAIVGGWVALSPFVIWSTLLEQVIAVSSGVAMFVFMAGPFSESPTVTYNQTLAFKPVMPEVERELVRAA